MGRPYPKGPIGDELRALRRTAMSHVGLPESWYLRALAFCAHRYSAEAAEILYRRAAEARAKEAAVPLPGEGEK